MSTKQLNQFFDQHLVVLLRQKLNYFWHNEHKAFKVSDRDKDTISFWQVLDLVRPGFSTTRKLEYVLEGDHASDE